jgi:hypothetical protein
MIDMQGASAEGGATCRATTPLLLLVGLWGNWLLPAIDAINLKIHMQYEDPETEIRDLDNYASESNIHTKPATISFVKTFYDINDR